MRALKNTLIIEEIKDFSEENISKSGIILAGAKETPPKAKVISVGGEIKEIKAGDTIYFNKEYSRTLEIEGKKYVFIREIDVLAVED